VQGGSFAYISPVLAIAAQIKATHTFASDHERFLVRHCCIPYACTQHTLLS
jgi:hypothetical protein